MKLLFGSNLFWIFYLSVNSILLFFPCQNCQFLDLFSILFLDNIVCWFTVLLIIYWLFLQINWNYDLNKDRFVKQLIRYDRWLKWIISICSCKVTFLYVSWSHCSQLCIVKKKLLFIIIALCVSQQLIKYVDLALK